MSTPPQLPPLQVPPKRTLPANSRQSMPPWAVSVMVIIWTLLALGIILGSLMLMAGLADAKSAIQEAAMGAVFAAFFVAGYILARCVEKILMRAR